AAAPPPAGTDGDVADPPPGATSTRSGSMLAVRATPASTSHHPIRGDGTTSGPGAVGTIEKLRRTRVRGRPPTMLSSDWTGSGNTWAPSIAGSTISGSCAALAPS